MTKQSDSNELKKKCIKPTEGETQLWLEMMKNMMLFTETSTALVERMQGRFQVPLNGTNSDQKQYNPQDILQQLKGNLIDMCTSLKPTSKCVCTSPSSGIDKSCSCENLPKMEYYKQPKLVKKKKHKYSSTIEKKILEKKGKCQCNGEGGRKEVDTCLCGSFPKAAEIRAQCTEGGCGITFCSDLQKMEILNVKCNGNTTKPVSAEDDLLSSIPMPGAYDPNELPQDDSNPFIIRGQEDFRMQDHKLGYELLAAMKKFGNNIAQIDDASGQQETYCEFLKSCLRVAINLKKQLSKTDIVGLYTRRHRNSTTPFLAALLNGNRVVAYDITIAHDLIANCLKNVTPKIMFASSDDVNTLKECMQAAQVDFKIYIFDQGGNENSFATLLAADDKEIDSFEADMAGSLNDTALICFTSATLGEPKAVCLSHYGLKRQSLQIISYYENMCPVILDYSELCQISSIIILFCSIFGGSSRIVVENFEAANVWKLVEKYKIRTMYLHAHQMTELSTYSETQADVSSLSLIFTGGEKLSRRVLENLKKLLISTFISRIYGHTEMCGITTMFMYSKPEDRVLMHFNNDVSGKSIDGIMYKVVSMETGKIVTHSSIGELHVKSKMIRNGYYVNNKQSCPCQKDDWFATGDIVYFDAYNCFEICGRKNCFIKSGNTFVNPLKLENILMTHPSVDAAVVIGVPNAGAKSLATAFVKLNNKDVISKELEDYVNSQVSPDEQLKGGVKIIESVPYGSNGKINRDVLLNEVPKNEI